MAEHPSPVNPGGNSFSSEDTRMEEPVVLREATSADTIAELNTICAQCKKEVKSPHLLCCLHSVCEECLPGMAVEGQHIMCGECGDTCSHLGNGNSSKDVMNQCRADIVHCVPVPNGPLSHYMEGVKIIEKISNQAFIPCGNKRCKTPDSPSAVHCMDCSIFMCERCNSGHEFGAFYENHTVKTLQEMIQLNPNNYQQMFSPSSSVYTCSRHREKILEYCCERCRLLMCQACAIEFKRHEPKQITSDSATTEPHRQSLRTAHQATGCYGEKWESLKEQLRTEVRTVEQAAEASLVSLNTAFQSIHDTVERRKGELHRQIISVAEKKKRAIESRLASVEKRMKAAVNARSTIELLLKSGSTHDLLSSKDLIQTYQSVLTSKWCEDELKITKSSVLNFEVTSQESVLKCIADFGIVTDGACPEQCIVDPKPHQHLQHHWSDPVMLQVVAFDSKGFASGEVGIRFQHFCIPSPLTQAQLSKGG